MDSLSYVKCVHSNIVTGCQTLVISSNLSVEVTEIFYDHNLNENYGDLMIKFTDITLAYA